MIAGAKVRGARGGYVYLHSAIDGLSRLAYTETLPNETTATTIDFWTRARALYAAHAITRITRVVTDNGSNLNCPGLVEALIPHEDEEQGSAEEVPRRASGAGHEDGRGSVPGDRSRHRQVRPAPPGLTPSTPASSP